MIDRISRLLRCCYYTVREDDCKGIQRRLPTIRPTLTSLPGRIETHHRQVHTLHGRLLGREMTPGLDRLTDPGVDALDGVRGVNDGADLRVEAQERHELRPGVL